jgi:hypothetical protein
LREFPKKNSSHHSCLPKKGAISREKNFILARFKGG